jgi:hypothetical protein
VVCFVTDGFVGNDMEIIAEIQRHPNYGSLPSESKLGKPLPIEGMLQGEEIRKLSASPISRCRSASPVRTAAHAIADRRFH